ncbi:hypothetical protein ACIFOT_32520, partial [Neobacillus sp. NRS-1170]|uniref:hypothetical protein n=1 Tax=Neobacillus sp. NRS-1170 TaxID=3233898 RepID=UPI003D267C5B
MGFQRIDKSEQNMGTKVDNSFNKVQNALDMNSIMLQMAANLLKNDSLMTSVTELSKDLKKENADMTEKFVNNTNEIS